MAFPVLRGQPPIEMPVPTLGAALRYYRAALQSEAVPEADKLAACKVMGLKPHRAVTSDLSAEEHLKELARCLFPGLTDTAELDTEALLEANALFVLIVNATT